MKVGYMRISTDKEEQKFDRQEDQLIDAKCEKIYSERISGKTNHKPQLEKMIEDLSKSGDEKNEVVVVSIDRLGRSTVQVIKTVECLHSLGIGLTSLKEGFQAYTPQGKFFTTVNAAYAELEGAIISDRVTQGLRSAKRRGKRLGRPRKSASVMDTAIRMWQSRDYSVQEILEISSISKQTLYNEIHRRGVSRDS